MKVMFTQATRYAALIMGVLAMTAALLLLLSGCGVATEPASADSVDPAPSLSVQSPPPEVSSSSSATVIEPPVQNVSVAEPPASSSSSSGSVAPTPAASSAASSKPAAPVKAAPWWNTIFTCEDTSVTVNHIYLHNNETKLSYPMQGDYPLIAGVLSLGTKSSDLGEPVLPNQYIELVLESDDKYAVELFEKGVILTHSHWKLKDKTQVSLAINPYDLNLLMQRCESVSNEGFSPRPLWLSMMNRGRLREITVENDKQGIVYSSEKENPNQPMMYLIEPYLRGITVEPHVRYMDKSSGLAYDYKATMTFNSGVVYTITFTERTMQIAASDVEKTLVYDLAAPTKTRTQLETILSKKINPNTPNYNYDFKPTEVINVNPDTGKPVIYLYPTKPTDCTVKVDYPAFTYTYPTYNNGWQVTAYPDGRLVNKADGSEHYYLFWEGNKQIDWQFDSGFTVPGSEVEAFFREKLAYMGLTPREYNDFITWWVPKMQDNPYNLITFATQQYEELAPLTVTPAPDSILRVHMVYKVVDAPVQLPEQTLSPFVRQGFTVVEWGGTVTR